MSLNEEYRSGRLLDCALFFRRVLHPGSAAVIRMAIRAENMIGLIFAHPGSVSPFATARPVRMA